MPSTAPLELTDPVVIARGLPASKGAATGKLVFSAEDALSSAGEGQQIILMKKQTLPSDVSAMMTAAGIVTQLGGLTCHAAIVARDLHKPCAVGCASLRLTEDRLLAEVEGQWVEVLSGELIALDGNTGEISIERRSDLSSSSNKDD